MLNRNLNRRSFLRVSTGVVLAGSAAGLLAACSAPTPAAAPTAAAAVKAAAPTVASSGASGIKVGVLNSLSGTMAISEVAVKNATLM
ncbi:MAG TPA: urea ABC transporter substrate-binding protein, partial [Chloroflexota bacterium]|nr:urea ABC transporter substrate-binding protein [Chloroflexota bacterium]